ncbi:unnamed protein product [Cylindrotheca closterium]|uniref:Uncharacterized protein n=1 Tax=Cylindrotheca closterium TaxID=2856 RepID=A0AAD2FT87_9STRA|nr:unnamed protein product [Cylindrotheca closterium]
MAPNSRATTLLTHSQFEKNETFPFDHDDSERYLSTKSEDQSKALTIDNGDDVNRVWESMIGGNLSPFSNRGDKPTRIHGMLSGIRILEDPIHNQDWLSDFGGSLHNVPVDQIEAIHDKAPQEFTARVADFNENLMYAMQSERGLEHLGLSSGQLQDLLQAKEYLGSFLTTEHTMTQPPHVDYMWEILNDYSKEDLKVGFFPLTKDGMFLQVWPRDDNAEQVKGQLIFIPFGKLLILPAHTIHGGGFRTTARSKGPCGNLRFHLYISKHGAQLPKHQTNKYTEPNNKGTELSWRYIDAPNMEELQSCFFV